MTESNTQIRPEREWTVDTLKAYFDAVHAESVRRYDQMLIDVEIRAKERIEAVDRRYQVMFDDRAKALDAALTAQKEAVSKAEGAAEKRFDSVNEFRAQLSDQASTFMPRAEAEQRIAQLTERFGDLLSRVDKREGHSSGMSASWAALLGVAGLVGAVVAVITRFI